MNTNTILTGSDRMNSVLWRSDTRQNISYTPFGSTDNDTPGDIGFTSERRDPVNGHTHLGNGYRSYSPTLMRFTCPDSLSPFGAGGVNPYAYCGGDPMNRADPSGHMPEGATIGIAAASIILSVLGIFTGGISLAAEVCVEAAVDTTVEAVVDSIDVLDDSSLPRLFGETEYEDTSPISRMSRAMGKHIRSIKMFNHNGAIFKGFVSLGANTAKLVAQNGNHVAKKISDIFGYVSLGLSFLTLPTTAGMDIRNFIVNGENDYAANGWRFMAFAGLKVSNRLLGTSGKVIKAVSDTHPEDKQLADDASYINFVSGVLGQGLKIYGFWNYGKWQSGAIGKIRQRIRLCPLIA